MHVKENVTKSFTSIYELFGPNHGRNGIYKRLVNKKISVKQPPCGDSKGKDFANDTSESKQMAYVTSEKYHNLNRNSSFTSEFHSNSTLFYDLDNLAVRHSFADLSEVSYPNCLSHVEVTQNQSPNGFKGKSHAIVQECATQLQPILQLPRDSLEINAKKMEKCFLNDAELSSEIFLRDDDFTNVSVQPKSDRHLNRKQKYWSYAKYRTEYTNPSRQDKKSKKDKKERTRQIEDPCPCQLFSYTCPCTENKSLTGLKNSKSLTDQITSTSNIVKEDRKEAKAKSHKGKNVIPKDDKPTSITCIIEKYDSVEKLESPIYSEKCDISTPAQNYAESTDIKCKSQSKRKRKVVCPNCKERVEVSSLDRSEGEESFHYDDSIYQTTKDSPISKSVYTYKTSVRKQMQEKLDEKDLCHHTPRCELVPLCQILPTDNVFVNYKTIRKRDTSKSSPRVIRVTKACRHHPPCTVAPSCQRANILKNNCEYIPPCLHRPRCVNLPLCVPFTKNMHYDELKHLGDMENCECPHIPRCKYVPECQQVFSGNLSNQVNVAQMQNAYRIMPEFEPSYNVKSSVPKSFSPCQIHPTGYVPNCERSRSDKSCQYDSVQSACSPSIQDSVSSEAVVFIRDVGCQFRNKYHTPTESLRPTKSSIIFDRDNIRPSNVYKTVHTQRYEDKFTNPKGKVEVSTSSLSLTSNYTENISEKHYDNQSRPTGFEPKTATSPFVAYATSLASWKHYVKEFNNTYTIPIKSRLSFTKSKYKKVFNIKRKRKKRSDSQFIFYKKPVLYNM